MEEEKKPSKIAKFFRLIWTSILYTIPSIRVLSYNKLLKKCRKITKDPWFTRQIIRDYVIAILLFIPILFGYYKINKIYAKDISFHNRIEKAMQVDSFTDRMSAYYSTVNIDVKDSKELKSDKFHTQIRLTAIGIVLFIVGSVQLLFAIVIIYFHPIKVKTDKLTKLLMSNGIIRKEDLNSSIVFATPIGFLITITGSSAKEIAYMDRIWSGLNIKIKDWVEDDEERSLVFFRKAFELQPTYLYDSFKEK